MKRLSFLFILIFSFMVESAAFADRGSLGGSWNYTLEGSDTTFDGNLSSFRITGNLLLDSDNESYQDELLKSYNISYDGYVKYGAKRDDFKGSYGEKFPVNTFVVNKEHLNFSYQVLINSKKAILSIEIRQESADKVYGEAILSGDASGKIILTAYRNPEKGSVEGCNAAGVSPIFSLAILPLLFKMRKR